MTTLTDRYVWAAARTLPEAQRTEFDRELRERIGDASDALIEQGRTPADAERDVLVDLGDPVALAAGYVDRPLYLIGPRYFLTWWRLLKLLLAVVLPFAALGIAIGLAVSGAAFGAIIGGTIGSTITVAVHLAFWTALVFAVIERSPDPRAAVAPWTIDRLPELPEPAKASRLGELIASLVFLGFFAVVLVWQQFGIPWVPELASVPLLDPDLWSFWLPYFLALIGLEILFAVALYAWGWNWWLVSANLVLNVAFTLPALWLFLTDQLVNPQALEAMNWPWGESGPVIVAIIVVVVIAASLWDVVDGALKTIRRHRARPVSAAWA